MFRKLCVAAMAVLLLGGGLFAQARNKKAQAYLKTLAKARYTLAEGIIRAQMKVPGRVLAAKTEVERKKKGTEITYKVYILRKGRIYKVEVDGVTGKVKEVQKKGSLFREEKEEKEEKTERRGKKEREERGEEEEEEENERAEHRGKRRRKERAEEEEEEENEHAEHRGKKEREERGEEEEEENERAEHKRKRRRRKL